MSCDDPALETLFLPFMQDKLAWPETGGALFLRAREGWPLHQRAFPGLVCEQSFKPDAEALERAGLQVVATEGERRHPLVLVLPPRQREEARALYARAVAHAGPGGRVVACASNNEGARSAEEDLRKLVGPVASLTKNKCRVFWSAPLHGDGGARIDEDLLRHWSALDAPRKIEGGRFTSRPGVFAWDRIDPASALLAAQLPPGLSGRAADFGAGFGYLSMELLERCPGITALDLYEAEARALELARVNLTGHPSPAKLGFHWHDVTGGLPGRYDVIVTNPPFHIQGRADRPDIGRRFIAVAAEALNPRGSLWLVANRHLPYETVLSESFGTVRTVAQQDGFKIIEAVKAAPARPAPKAERRWKDERR